MQTISLCCLLRHRLKAEMAICDIHLAGEEEGVGRRVGQWEEGGGEGRAGHRQRGLKSLLGTPVSPTAQAHPQRRQKTHAGEGEEGRGGRRGERAGGRTRHFDNATLSTSVVLILGQHTQTPHKHTQFPLSAGLENSCISQTRKTHVGRMSMMLRRNR